MSVKSVFSDHEVFIDNPDLESKAINVYPGRIMLTQLFPNSLRLSEVGVSFSLQIIRIVSVDIGFILIRLSGQFRYTFNQRVHTLFNRSPIFKIFSSGCNRCCKANEVEVRPLVPTT